MLGALRVLASSRGVVSASHIGGLHLRSAFSVVPLSAPKTSTTDRSGVSRSRIFTGRGCGRHQTHLTTLSNGLRVASNFSPGISQVIGLFIDSGSRRETAATNGVAHFLEHLYFKGTVRRSREALEREIEAMGAQLNAYTAREVTVYSMRAFANDSDHAMDLLSDILTNSTLSAMALEEERRVILREMEEVAKTPEEVALDDLHTQAFPRSSLGLPILGPARNIQQLSRKDISAYSERNYSADRMVIVGVGTESHEKLTTLSRRHFGKVRGSDLFKEATPAKADFCGFPAGAITSQLKSRGRILQRLSRSIQKGGTGCLAIAIEGLCWTHPRAPVMMLLQTLLGSYSQQERDVSLLPVSLLERGLSSCLTSAQSGSKTASVLNLNTFNTYYSDTGLLGVCITGRDAADIIATGTQIVESLRDFHRSVSEEDLSVAKSKLRMAVCAEADAANLFEDIGRNILTHGRRLLPAELMDQIDQIDLATVRAMAERHLTQGSYALGVS